MRKPAKLAMLSLAGVTAVAASRDAELSSALQSMSSDVVLLVAVVVVAAISCIAILTWLLLRDGIEYEETRKGNGEPPVVHRYRVKRISRNK